jgi:hypothetical protein
MSTKPPCLICGAKATTAHHPTGRDPLNAYLDPMFTVPACHDHHTLAHDDWFTLGVPEPNRGARSKPERLTYVERVEWRLRRLAAGAGRLAAAFPEHAWIARLAECLKCWADELARDIAARDRRDPYWRCDPSFYPVAP